MTCVLVWSGLKIRFPLTRVINHNSTLRYPTSHRIEETFLKLTSKSTPNESGFTINLYIDTYKITFWKCELWLPKSRVSITMENMERFTTFKNRKHFPCFLTVIETRVEVWESEKLKWEHEPVGRVFPRYLEFSQTFISVSITYGNTEKMFSVSFIK